MEKISKNCIKGDLIIDPFDLNKIAHNKGSVYFINWGIKPAAVYMSMQFRIILRLIEEKRLYKVINLKKENGITKN